MNRSRVLKRIQRHADELRACHHVKALFIFGSFARGESTARSDLDILVDFSSNKVGLFQFLRLKDYLESILDRKIDLVTRDAIREWMRAEIERDAIRAA